MGTNFIPDGFANFCFKKSFIPKLLFFYSIGACRNGYLRNIVTTFLFMTLLLLFSNFELFRLYKLFQKVSGFFPKCLLFLKNSSCYWLLACPDNLTDPNILKNISSTQNSWNQKSTKSLLWLVIVKLNVSCDNSNLIPEITQITRTGITIARKFVRHAELLQPAVCIKTLKKTLK